MKEFLLYFWNMPIEEFRWCLAFALLISFLSSLRRWWNYRMAKKGE